MEKIFDTIRKRYSVRTYEERPIENEAIQKLNEVISAQVKGPFGSKVRFKLVDAGPQASEELKKFVSYGNVKGSRYFIAGCVEKGKKAMEDFGYCMEQIVLFATSLDLGTVWLGGSLNRTTFAEKLGASEKEVIPAISPVGYPSEKRTLIDRVTRTLSGGKNRKESGELFFSNDLSNALTKEACGQYNEVLEAVRWAPSASNKQPWRIIKDKNTYHFYMNETPGYNSAIKDVQMQNNDMGIAMCHFEMMAKDLGLPGYWKEEKPSIDAGKLVYIVSWVG